MTHTLAAAFDGEVATESRGRGSVPCDASYVRMRVGSFELARGARAAACANAPALHCAHRELLQFQTRRQAHLPLATSRKWSHAAWPVPSGSNRRPVVGTCAKSRRAANSLSVRRRAGARYETADRAPLYVRRGGPFDLRERLTHVRRLLRRSISPNVSLCATLRARARGGDTAHVAASVRAVRESPSD